MNHERIIAALKIERDLIAKGVGYLVVSARRTGGNLVLVLEPRPGGRSQSVDESLEGCRALWGGNGEGRGDVLYVNPDEGEVVLQFCLGEPPEQGASVQLFQRDFLSPMISLWERPSARARAGTVAARSGSMTEQTSDLPKGYTRLRNKQREAVRAGLEQGAILIGPPGTGKTYTVGAVIARQLTKFKNSRVIITGPTNVAVDHALLAASDWLEILGRPALIEDMKRLGAWFDPGKYTNRQELLAPGVYAAASRLALLELDEPSKREVEAYVKWKEATKQARKELRAEIEDVAKGARVIAATTASLAQWYDIVRGVGPWHFLVCDEASQISLPTALMMGGLGQRSLFAGDPQQLAPVVQASDKTAKLVLEETIFESMPQAERTILNEQSRMCVGICQSVSRIFYGDQLKVCAKSLGDGKWRKFRTPHFVNGREVPRLYVENISQDAVWSKKYSGKIRLESALVARDVVEAFLGSYVDIEDILILTPFRSQRALMRRVLTGDSTKRLKISTVHRAQGSEKPIVIFDAVDAASAFLNSPNGKRLINVAISRAQVHAVVIANDADLANPWLAKLSTEASRLWHKSGDYAAPFQVPRSGPSK